MISFQKELSLAAEHVKEYLSYLYSCQEIAIVARYKMSQSYVMEKEASYQAKIAAIDHCLRFYHLLHQQEGCLC